MREYEVLEKRWLKYRIKKFLRYIVSIALIGAGGWLYFQPNTSQPSLDSTPQNVVTPSMEFEKRLDKYLSASSSSKKKMTKKSSSSISSSSSKEIVIASEEENLQALIKKYRSTPSLELALLIAQNYYDKKEFTKAIEWSMKANEFDPKDEESWLLFAKAAYKQGDKQRAIEALRAYAKKTGSIKAKELLEQFYKGSFQ